MEETTQLRAAIENLYTTFEGYPLRDDTNACDCCHSPEDEKRLHRKSLRKLEIRDLRLYAADALFVWGDVTDFRHFLPRIFELAVAHEDAFEITSIIFNKLYRGDWRSWPDAEQRSIERFFDALWARVLEEEPREFCGDEIEDWLCGFAQAVTRLSPYLDTWIALESKNALLNLARFIADTYFANPSHRSGGFWQGRDDLFNEVLAWVQSDIVRKKMAIIAVRYPEYGFVERAYTSLP
jgi:hypothetical protein